MKIVQNSNNDFSVLLASPDPVNARELPKHGEVWKHFKDNLYEIIECPVYHTETNERMVCYRALYGDYMVYVRPLTMFMSEVDHEKYPDVKQQYRFERIVNNATVKR